MKNNSDIFSDLDYSQIYLSLLKGDLPIKFAYMTPEGALAWEKLEKKGHHSNHESELLVICQDIYLKEVEAKNSLVIFDFGCGVGSVIESFIENIIKDKIIYYHAFDISSRLIERNKEYISSKFPSINYDSTIIDFEKGNFFESVLKAKSKYNNENVLGLFLGNTLGNFASEERILSSVMEVLSVKDRLIVGIGRSQLGNKNWLESLIESYKSEDVVNVFKSTIEYLGATEMVFDVNFDKQQKTMNVEGKFTNDTRISIKDKTLDFKKGTSIRLGKSKKIDEEELSKIAENLNLRICNLKTSLDNKYMQICLSNQRYSL